MKPACQATAVWPCSLHTVFHPTLPCPAFSSDTLYLASIWHWNLLYIGLYFTLSTSSEKSIVVHSALKCQDISILMLCIPWRYQDGVGAVFLCIVCQWCVIERKSTCPFLFDYSDLYKYIYIFFNTLLFSQKLSKNCVIVKSWNPNWMLLNQHQWPFIWYLTKKVLILLFLARLTDWPSLPAAVRRKQAGQSGLLHLNRDGWYADLLIFPISIHLTKFIFCVRSI